MNLQGTAEITQCVLKYNLVDHYCSVTRNLFGFRHPMKLHKTKLERPAEIPKYFCYALRRLRAERGLSQAQMTKLLGFGSQQSYQYYETGLGQATIKRFKKWAEILNVDYKFFLGEEVKEVIYEVDFAKSIPREWLQATGLRPGEFVTQCLLRYGQKTRDELAPKAKGIEEIPPRSSNKRLMKF